MVNVSKSFVSTYFFYSPSQDTLRETRPFAPGTTNVSPWLVQQTHAIHYHRLFYSIGSNKNFPLLLTEFSLRLLLQKFQKSRWPQLFLIPFNLMWKNIYLLLRKLNIFSLPKGSWIWHMGTYAVLCLTGCLNWSVVFVAYRVKQNISYKMFICTSIFYVKIFYKKF